MGLFSLFGKNKQETAGQDSAYYSREEDPAAVRARSKRASTAGEGAAPRSSRKTRAVDDPVLPEKKRARRRLVGAVALALAVAVGLPMILDSEPKPIASDIAIQIPSRDKVAPLPLPTAPVEARGAARGETPPAAETLDQREQLVDPNEVKTVKLKSADAPVALADARPVKKADTAADDSAAASRAKADRDKADRDKAEARARSEAEAAVEAKARAEAKAKVEAKTRLAEKAKEKDKERLADKPARADDAARAQAILDGKAKPADAGGAKFVVQVAALGSQEKVDELQEKLGAAGIRAHTHKVSTPAGERIQVRVGPFSREEADRMRARLDKAGLGGSMIRPEGK